MMVKAQHSRNICVIVLAPNCCHWLWHDLFIVYINGRKKQIIYILSTCSSRVEVYRACLSCCSIPRSFVTFFFFFTRFRFVFSPPRKDNLFVFLYNGCVQKSVFCASVLVYCLVTMVPQFPANNPFLTTIL